MELTSKNVNDTFKNCLFSDGENTENYVKAESIEMTIGFHPERLQDNKGKISLMLNDLPDSFMKNKGGGMSFLNMCQDKKDNQWTGSHETMDQLVALGLASNKMSYLMPREMWISFPGGMPYLVVDCE